MTDAAAGRRDRLGRRTRRDRARRHPAAAFWLGAAVLTGGCETAPSPAGPRLLAGTVGVEGADLYYQAVGSGEPIVVVHGGPGLDHTYLRDGLEPLAGSYRLIFYDQRGLGRSPARLDSTSLSMTRYLDDLDAIRERVAGVDRVTILAHSWGAIPAVLYAMRWPERVSALVLVSPVEPGQRFAEETAARQRAARTEEDAAAIDSLASLPGFAAGDPDVVNGVFFHVFRSTFADPAVADSVLTLRLEERTARQGREVARRLMTPLAGLDLWDRLPELDVPALLVHGDADPIPLDMVRELERALPRARLAVIGDAGHFPFLERPAPVFEAIRGFLARVGASSSPSSPPTP